LTPVQAAKVARNPYKGATNLNKPHFLQTYQGAYKSQWNNEAKSIGLTTAEI
jgi:ribonuclease BN (tRNA processing enzyme)